MFLVGAANTEVMHVTFVTSWFHLTKIWLWACEPSGRTVPYVILYPCFPLFLDRGFLYYTWKSDYPCLLAPVKTNYYCLDNYY